MNNFLYLIKKQILERYLGAFKIYHNQLNCLKQKRSPTKPEETPKTAQPDHYIVDILDDKLATKVNT